MKAIFGSGNKKEEACELLTDAANKYKIVKKWNKCGECHRRVAQIQLDINDKFAAAAAFQQAFQAYKKEDGPLCREHIFPVYRTHSIDMAAFQQAFQAYKKEDGPLCREHIFLIYRTHSI